MEENQQSTILFNASQLLTLAGGPQRGNRLGNLGIIDHGAVAIVGERIVDVGTSSEILNKYSGFTTIDVQGKVVMPGFVDPHTHLVWAGDRAAEFELRLQGKTYMEILRDGGGILSTVRATRDAALEDLVQQTRERAWRAFSHGTTTMEVKTGYGLTFESEVKLMQAILKLNQDGPLELVPTFLAAHAVPPEFQDQTDAYVALICDEMLPKLFTWWQKEENGLLLPFVDVFCEKGAFDLEQSCRILKAAASLGFPTKIHADEFENLGGASLAASLGAASADHLVKTSHEDILALASSNNVAVSLPATPFGLGEDEYTPCKAILEAGGLLALATDINPGTAWCESMQFILALSCRKMGLTPAQAISAATINAAAAIQKEEEIGSLEAGKQADLLVLDVNDYRHLGYRFGTNLVSHIIKRGHIYLIQ